VRTLFVACNYGKQSVIAGAADAGAVSMVMALMFH